MFSIKELLSTMHRWTSREYSFDAALGTALLSLLIDENMALLIVGGLAFTYVGLSLFSRFGWGSLVADKVVSISFYIFFVELTTVCYFGSLFAIPYAWSLPVLLFFTWILAGVGTLLRERREAV